MYMAQPERVYKVGTMMLQSPMFKHDEISVFSCDNIMTVLSFIYLKSIYIKR